LKQPIKASRRSREGKPRRRLGWSIEKYMQAQGEVAEEEGRMQTTDATEW
jgi:hypothetical protein